MKTKIACRVALLALAGFLVVPAANADAVTDWNEITLTAVTAGRPGTIGVVDVALVQVAVHDAVQALEHRYEPYHAEIDVSRADRANGSRSAAVAAAAHDMLVALYPAQAPSLDATYYSYLADRGLNGDPGIAVGQQIALRILPLRRANPSVLPPPFVGNAVVGTWRPTDSLLGNPPSPAPFSPMATPWMADFDPFTLTSPARFRAAPPPALTSARYTRDYQEVKRLGAFANSARSAEQTDLAYFYSDNTPALWNRTLRGIARRYLHRNGDSARLLALANLATADALISCWDSKRLYAYWRPVTAIHEGDADGNPATEADASWQPLINTPNYPDYTSGANSVSGTVTRVLQLYFGTDKVPFDVESRAPQAIQKTRRYYRFSDAADDVVDARIFLGIHFRFADTAAREQGRKVADWTFNHFLLPLDQH